MKNTYEKLFDEFLDLTEFALLKHKTRLNEDDAGTGLFSLKDCQGGNFGDIEAERFETASQILDRMDIYIQDYIVEALSDAFDETDTDIITDAWEELLKYRDRISGSDWDFDVLDMAINHANEINLENCIYELVD